MTSDRGSLPEVVGDAGILLPPDDTDAWSEALGRVLADGDLAASLRHAGRQRAALFTWQRTAEATRALYRAAE